jgi:hypothetical protein
MSDERTLGARGSFADWALRLIGSAIGFSIAVVAGGIVFPRLLTPAFLVAAVFLGLTVISLVMMLFRMAQYFVFRRAYYGQIPPGDRKEAYTQELRSRHAPEWYVRMGRGGRVAYVAGVFLVATAVVLLRPFPGDPHFGLRLGLFTASFLVVLVVLWRLRR